MKIGSKKSFELAPMATSIIICIISLLMVDNVYLILKFINMDYFIVDG